MAGAQAVLHLATCIAPTSAAWRRSASRENDRIRIEGTQNLLRHAATDLPADSGRRARHGARNASLHAQRHKSRAYVAARPRRADECRQAARPPRPPGRGASLSPLRRKSMRAAERHGRPLRPPATNLPADSGHRARHGARNASLRAQRHKSRADVAARPAEADGARRFPVPVRPKSRCWFIRASHRSTPTAAPAGSPTGSPFVGRGDAYQPLVSDEDAAALVTAAEPPNLRGTFDVVDDEPLTRTQLASAPGGRCRAAARATAADPRGAGRPRRADGVPPA